MRFAVASTVVVASSAILLSCSPPARMASDAQARPDAPLAGCGDGVMNGPEECDDGALNGTAQSFCTKACLDGRRYHMLGPLGGTPLPVPYTIKKLVHLEFFNLIDAVAFTGFDDDGVHVATGLSETHQPDLISLKVHSAPVSLGRVWKRNGAISSPIWIERPVAGVGGPWLFFADIDEATNTATIHEIPYPFPDGRGGELVSEQQALPILVDQSSTTGELLVAVIAVLGDNSVRTFTARLPAAGTQRSAVASAPDISFEDNLYHCVVFFSDTESFQTLELSPDSPTDVFGDNGPYAITELARGPWPFHVVQATHWLEKEYLRPIPTAILTDTGDIYLWQFSSAPPGGEGSILPYAHVTPGSLIGAPNLYLPVGGASYTFYPTALWVLDPDGTQTALIDGEMSNVHSSSLHPLTAPATSPWTSAVYGDDLQGVNNWRYLSVDNRILWLKTW